MRRRSVWTIILLVFVASNVRPAHQALAAGPGEKGKPRVTLEIVTTDGLAITSSQQWQQTLGKLGLDGIRIHSASGGEKTEVENVGSAAAPRYKVVGILKADNILYLPGGKFTTSDTGKLQSWLSKLGDQGVEAVTEERGAFGLLPKQFEQVQKDLKQPLDIDTKDAPLAGSLAKVSKRLAIPLLIDPSLQDAIAQVTTEEDLSAVSRGTALAILLRPAGLVLVPERPAGGDLQYRVVKPKAGVEAWPIGWQSPERNVKLLPALFEFVEVEIADVTVTQALDALEEQIKAPFFMDHNALALHGIDPSKINAAVPGKRLTYSLILQKVLFQAKLKYEVRLDEAGKPLIWITSIKGS